jgi:hypothetical protein
MNLTYWLYKDGNYDKSNENEIYILLGSFSTKKPLCKKEIQG